MISPPIKPDLLLLGMGPVFVAFIVGEYFFSRKNHPERFDFKDTANNVVLSLLQQGAEFFFLFINWLFVVTLYTNLYEYGLKLVPENISWLWFVVLFVTQDFLYYWFHRVSHRVRWFWSAHVAHHSSEYLNFSTALRQSILYPFTGMWIFWLPLAYIGFSPEWITFIVAINLAFQFFVHTQAVKNLGVLEYIFNTPSHHRVHHAKNAQYIDKNYAGVFIIWDKMFGTFVPENEACVYGITKKVNYRNAFESNMREFLDMLAGARRSRSFSGKLKWFWGPPEWSDGEHQDLKPK
jgi:sterol desaturase/sphingolipid hydroxylase (fatty acid hydroxylase superfamily)